MFENATKGLVMVLAEMGETVDADLGIMELKQKLMLSTAYLEDEEFVRDVSATTIEDRMKKEDSRKEEFKKKAEERRLERIQELELARIEVARWKAEKEARIREARHAQLKEARLRAERGGSKTRS
ncbi:hypothetical protein TNCT_384871 [Trichonephila clavata]|uniref:Uncharacterized protein n=1 Tax=Trichonephila clavata TaxID=2740835 RepID=A0A8X6FER9_TRICU|nr:hypothetical protein TNCT_384871 [Trichonephila clavata]